MVLYRLCGLSWDTETFAALDSDYVGKSCFFLEMQRGEIVEEVLGDKIERILEMAWLCLGLMTVGSWLTDMLIQTGLLGL